MAELKDRYIRFDWAIKRLLRQNANFGVLEVFLTVFLNQPIKIVEILESEGNQETVDDKFNRVDIKAKDSNGDIIIVEIQNTSELYYLERVLYGVANAITEHIKFGNTYQEVKKVYYISILYFDLGKGKDYLYVGQHAYDEHVNAVMIQNDVLGTAKMEGIAEGKKKGREEGLKEGREAGLEEGRSEAHGNLLKTARKLKAMGLSVGDIAEATGLSEKNVEKAYHDDLF